MTMINGAAKAASAEAGRTGWPIDRIFLLLGSLCFVFGVTLGVYMGIKGDHSLAPVHVHVNLVGWVSLMLFGLFYRAHPALAATRMARVHLTVSGSSGLLFPFGLYMVFAHGRTEFVGIPALLWLAGALLFFGVVLRLFLSGTGASEQATASRSQGQETSARERVAHQDGVVALG